MPIPEAQLSTWTNQGAISSSADTYNSITAALAGVTWPEGCRPEVFLQGSYRNSTNIYSESDVDIVVRFDCTFKSDVSTLPPDQAQAYVNDFEAASYPWKQAYDDTLSGLNKYYGSGKVHPGNKAIQVDTPYRSADVVVSIEHRKYSQYISVERQHYISGISIFAAKENRWIVNFPKQHYENGVAKQSRTSNRYKSTVRMIKNANRYMVMNNIIAEGVAPSYGIECLVYSVPDEQFTDDWQTTYCNVVNWAASNSAVIRRVSEQGGIVGSEPGMWQTAACEAFISKLVGLWNDWT